MKLLAFDTSTDTLSIAVSDGQQQWQHTGPGAAQAGGSLIPTILALLAQADLRLQDLDAIAFGRGPGSFTGLRTACSVAQGLALGADVPVLPIDTLMALAEQARLAFGANCPSRVTALLDARMNEVYFQRYEFDSEILIAVGHCELISPKNLAAHVDLATSQLFAGNVFEVYAHELPALALKQTALPTASAMLRLAPGLIAAGQCVAADQALPFYVRDKVAQTTQERALAKAHSN